MLIGLQKSKHFSFLQFFMENDYIKVFIFSFCQLFLIPFVTANTVHVDILTPWLVVFFIINTANKAFPLALLSAFIIETHTSSPAGLFISIYISFGAVFYLIKPHISWKSLFLVAVAVVFAKLYLYMIIILYKLDSFSHAGDLKNILYYIEILFQIVLSVIIGLYFFISDKSRTTLVGQQ